MQDLEPDDRITGRLIAELRARARRMRWMGYAFIGAIILVIGAATAFYYFSPQLARQESEARIKALQERLKQQEAEITAAETSAPR